ncbi:MAG: hypothetical protein U0229_11295 [Anaeromyxobacter sp.]
MAVSLTDRDWLGALVDGELEAYDPANARARLPAEVLAAAESATDLAAAGRVLVARAMRRRAAPDATPEAAFLDEVRRHVGLLLDLGALRGVPFVRARARAELAAFLAAACGAHAAALAARPDEPGGASDAAVARALASATRVMHARFWPPAEPPGGLPIRPAVLALFRRRLARVASGFHREGALSADALARHAAHAGLETSLVAEALAGLLAAAGAPAERDLAVRVRQVAHLGLSRVEARAARHGVRSPRTGEVLAAVSPPASRPFLLEQLRLAQLRRGLLSPAAVAHVEAFARATGLEAPAVLAAQLEAAAQHAGQEELPAVAGGARDWAVVAEEWEAATDDVLEKVSGVVAGNLEALATELKETGELGQLVAKAASGGVLTQDERRKVREQLVDLAKAVPALAIFAAPGGAILLPLLAKLLPFSLLPSAWDGKGGPPATSPGAAPSPPAGRPRSPRR